MFGSWRVSCVGTRWVRHLLAGSAREGPTSIQYIRIRSLQEFRETTGWYQSNVIIRLTAASKWVGVSSGCDRFAGPGRPFIAQQSRELYCSALLADSRRSALSAIQFCEIRQISFHSLLDWLHRL